MLGAFLAFLLSFNHSLTPEDDVEQGAILFYQDLILIWSSIICLLIR